MPPTVKGVPWLNWSQCINVLSIKSTLHSRLSYRNHQTHNTNTNTLIQKRADIHCWDVWPDLQSFISAQPKKAAAIGKYAFDLPPKIFLPIFARIYQSIYIWTWYLYDGLVLFLKESNPKINKIKPQVFVMACHPFGCRVVQRVLEHCTQQQVSWFALFLFSGVFLLLLFWLWLLLLLLLLSLPVLVGNNRVCRGWGC